MPQAAVIEGLGQIHVSCVDFDRALRFYRDVLGLALLFDVPAQKMAFFDLGGVRLYLGVPSSPEYRANSFLYYRVADIDAAHAALSEKGVDFASLPHLVHRTATSELWMAGFRDSEGNLAQLMCERSSRV